MTRLGELAQEQGHQIELLAVGGAVMVLAYNARASTHDVDVFILLPKEAQIARKLAHQVAQEWNGRKIGLMMAQRGSWWASARGQLFSQLQALL